MTRGRTHAVDRIVVHFTSTLASARNNAAYFARNEGQGASAHYFVDDITPEIYQSVAEGDTAWHAGDWQMNCRAIGIEVVSAGEDFSDVEVEKLSWLVQRLMDKYGIGASGVIRHYDVTGKRCPAPYVAAPKWKALKARVLEPPEPAAPPKPPLPAALAGFTDLDGGAWYVGALARAVEAGYISGYGDGRMGPHDALARGQAACLVANAAGAEFTHPFTDVVASPYWYDAVAWAKGAGVVSGDGGRFRPEDPCLRCEFAAMLYNWRGGGEEAPDASGFPDWASVPAWARGAVAWAAAHGVMGATGSLRATDVCTRAEAAAMLVNLVG